MTFNTNRRRTFTDLQRAAFFEQHKGICYLCGQKVRAPGEKWEIEHIIAREIMGEGADDDSNLAIAHVDCHRVKTAHDKATIAKSNRIRAKHIGAHRSAHPIPNRPFGGHPSNSRDIYADMEADQS